MQIGCAIFSALSRPRQERGDLSAPSYDLHPLKGDLSGHWVGQSCRRLATHISLGGNGRVLKDYLEGRSVTEAARHIGVSRVNLSRLLNEQAGVSAGISLRSKALEASPEFWFKMQMNFDLWQASRKKPRRSRRCKR